jgi:hypothetical protein
MRSVPFFFVCCFVSVAFVGCGPGGCAPPAQNSGGSGTTPSTTSDSSGASTNPNDGKAQGVPIQPGDKF